ncbi:hypothetical protein M8818_006452 [Zalaria obscura]|uniref:Uncharacterized protein n=1 Tax=Zalaria obscura TaxID=2024903 RepID=A0ACC3S698_9PEZI
MQSASRSASSGQPIGSWDELKLSTLLDELLDAASLKKDSGKDSSHDTFFRESFLQRSELEKRKEELPDLNTLAVSLSNHVNNRIRALAGQPSDTKFEIRDEAPAETEDPANQSKTPRTIIHIRDIHNLRMTRQGDAIVNRLARLVQKRRRDGEQIMIIGTVASSRVLPMTSSEEDEESLFRTIISHPWPKYHTSVLSSVTALSSPPVSDRSLANPGYKRLLDINFRNIQSLIRRLKLPMDENAFTNNFRQHLNLPGTSRLGDHALPQVEIQRIVLHAEGLRTLFTQSPTLTLAHIALSAMILEVADTAMGPKAIPTPIVGLKPMERTGGTANGAAKRERSRPNMELIRKNASKHEQKMLSGVVDPQNIKTTFNQVHAPKETIEALKTLTTLSLLRPEAFSYGVLANDRLPGLLLYGPPGTGKTLLAKAVAKESQATVLEVSGAQVYEKYVGEGEKMVKAVFSLARKLSPCVVFIDEADALFGSRGNAGNRTTHREIINQFLREWDGMDDHGVFMMVATNRPFDLDDAVLRRLPRRLLVDLPVAKDRESILGIHLKGETLDPEVSLAKLAEQTPLYSGSDLKNLCVAAALTAVREENELLAEHKDDKEFKLPERRTLNVKHFEKAIAEISASINEDMSSLSAIRKFDEQFGDRRGRRKKSGYGFGGAAEVDESAARVRDQPRP